MSVLADVQKLIRDTLAADATVAGMISGIHDDIPTNAFGARQAYLSFGPCDVVAEDADCIAGAEITVQIDAWVRGPTRGVDCRRVVDAIKTCLHEAELELTDNALVEMRVDFRSVRDDPDGLTKHGICQVTAMAEEREGS